jgi:hypothetical protein
MFDNGIMGKIITNSYGEQGREKMEERLVKRY